MSRVQQVDYKSLQMGEVYFVCYHLPTLPNERGYVEFIEECCVEAQKLTDHMARIMATKQLITERPDRQVYVLEQRSYKQIPKEALMQKAKALPVDSYIEYLRRKATHRLALKKEIEASKPVPKPIRKMLP